MKQPYVPPVVELVWLDDTDIIVTSGEETTEVWTPFY